MPKSLELKTGKFMVLEAPVRNHKKAERTYVDVQGNGRMYNTFPEALEVFNLIEPKFEPVIVVVLHTVRDTAKE